MVGAMLPWWGFLCLVSEALGSGGRHPSSWCSLWGSCWPSLGLSSSNAVTSPVLSVGREEGQEDLVLLFLTGTKGRAWGPSGVPRGVAAPCLIFFSAFLTGPCDRAARKQMTRTGL